MGQESRTGPMGKAKTHLSTADTYRGGITAVKWKITGVVLRHQKNGDARRKDQMFAVIPTDRGGKLWLGTLGRDELFHRRVGKKTVQRKSEKGWRGIRNAAVSAATPLCEGRRLEKTDGEWGREGHGHGPRW